MIYITGDTHGDFKRFSKKRMTKKALSLTSHDYVIVCGDFGLCWAEDKEFAYNCDFFAGRSYTVLWVQGNHENYDMIKQFPIEEWHGGKVRHIVRDKVILLERGQVFEIEGKTFFTFGGAASRDIQGGILSRDDEKFKLKVAWAKKQKLPYRILGESWWSEELPSEEEMDEGLKNLEKVNDTVDYVITHCCSTGMQDAFNSDPEYSYKANVLTDYFDQIEERIEFKHWYFGHYHNDRKIDDKHTLVYYGMIGL